MSGSRPVLGLTTYLQQAQTGVWNVRASFLPAIYIDGVNLAGGIVSLLPPQPVDADIASRILDGLDGLIITGGRDLVPEGYGQQPHPATDEAVTENRLRDNLEYALVNGAIRRDIPLLGICRGAQVINVALGGTLHQHLPDVLGHNHHQLGNAVFSTSSVRTVPAPVWRKAWRRAKSWCAMPRMKPIRSLVYANRFWQGAGSILCCSSVASICRASGLCWPCGRQPPPCVPEA